MAENDKARRRRFRVPVFVAIAPILAFLAALLLVRYIQRGAGADHAAFGSYPDEPSHFLSGVMIHDYLAHGWGSNPFTWASDYYLHVPFFAVGYWPPFFYVVEALWMFVFGVGWMQALWLSAAVAALTAATIFFQARQAAGVAIATCAGLVYLLWPPVQWSDCALMTDTTVALMSLLASIALGKYLETERTGPALLFGVCAAMAILTKYSGLFLVLIPVPAVMLMRRWRLFRRPSFWAMPALVALLWAPWLLMSARYAAHGLVHESADGVLSRTATYLSVLAFGSGPPIGLVLLAGWVGAAILWKRLKGREIVWLLQALATLLFLAAAPIPVESRYLVPILPPLILLTCSTLGRLADLARESGYRAAQRFAVPALILLTAIYARASIFDFAPPRPDDVAPVARFVLNGKHLRNASVLAPADDEGRFIAEAAALDSARGERVLVRPNKLLAEIDWNSYNYKAFYSTPEQVEALFEQNPIDVMVLHDPLRAHAWPHERLLNEVVEEFPDQWRLAGAFPARSGRYRIYQFAEPAAWGKLSPLLIQRMRRMEDLPGRGAASERSR